MEVIQTTLIIYTALCLGFTVILTGGQNGQTDSHPGQDVTLSCFVPVNNFSNCEWYFTQNGGEERSLTKGTRYTWSCSKDGSTWVRNKISFKNVTFNDSGIYTCGANRGKIVLNVLAKPEITVHKTNYTAVTGTNVTLECIVNANGEINTSIQWMYEGNQKWIQARISEKYFWTNQMPSLVISNVQTSDSRFYRCLASTHGGMAEGPAILLNVQTKPEITVHKTNYTAVSGTNVILECIVNANGEIITSIEWEYKLNQQWIRARISEKYFWTIQMPSLVISNIQTSDSRFYRCLASTRVGTAEGPAILVTVQIPVKIKELETSPVFIRESDTVEIRCLVDGKPEPKVTWKLANGTTIVASSLKNMQENILILENVTNLTEGNYTCIADNNFSRDEYLLYLTVSDHRLFNPPNEDLTGSPLEKYVVPGVSVFVCVTLIALIVVVILIRRKRRKGRTDKPDLEIRSTNGQEHPSPSANIRSGNNHSKFYVHLSGDMTYAQVIRKSSKIIDENKSIRDTNITQSNTHIDGNKSILDTDASQVYMNINNAYAAVQQHSSTTNSNSCINKETESENTQVNKTEELNYVELEFSSNAQDENSSHGIRGSPSDTTYTEVVVFSR